MKKWTKGLGSIKNKARKVAPEAKVFDDDDKLAGLGAAYRVERFVARNWVKVFVAFLVAIVISSVSAMVVYVKAMKQVSGMQKILRDHLNKVLVATPDGRIVEVARVDVNAQFVRNQVRNFIVSKLIVGKLDLYVRDEFPSLEQLYDLNPRVKEVLEDWTASVPEAQRKMKAYWKYLYSLAAGDKLPEVVKPLSIENEKYEVQDNEFYYEGVYKVFTMAVNIKQEWVQGYGTVSYRLEGYFKPVEGSEDNPYGLRITSISVSYVTK